MHSATHTLSKVQYPADTDVLSTLSHKNADPGTKS